MPRIAEFLPHHRDDEPPAIVLEHSPPRRSPAVPHRTPGKPEFDVVTFASWTPRAVWQAGIKRIRLGEPDWKYRPLPEVAALIGEGEIST